MFAKAGSCARRGVTSPMAGAIPAGSSVTFQAHAVRCRHNPGDADTGLLWMRGWRSRGNSWMSTTTNNQDWKKKARLEAVARRMRIDSARKKEMETRIYQQLKAALLDVLSDCVVGFCWPYKGEFDQRFFMRDLRERGARTALPIVVKNASPMIFRLWRPGVAMAPGVFGIPVPKDTPLVKPDLVLPPMNAFDDAGFRLGYGGGFFDRTLAAIEPRPLAVGVAFEEQRVATIYPTEHDIPMDFIVTEANVYRRLDGRVGPVSTGECSAAVIELMRRRALPREQDVRPER